MSTSFAVIHLLQSSFKAGIAEEVYGGIEDVVQESKIEKVPRGIRGEKSSKDMASSRNLVSTIGALASPKMGDGTRCPENNIEDVSECEELHARGLYGCGGPTLQGQRH